MPLITKVIRPEDLNAIKMADIICDNSYSIPIVGQARRLQVDLMQVVLDRLVAEGILGTEEI